MTTAFVTVDKNHVTIYRRAIGPGGIVGDMILGIEPDENYDGWTYEDLKAHGSGAIEIPKPALTPTNLTSI